ncbi:MAG: hypothetical protein ABIF82_11455 [Planctomycetota bacterium]
MSSGVEISKRLVLINSASTVVVTVLNMSVFVWLQQYLVRRISAEEYSLLPVLAAVMVFTPLVSVVLTSGIGRYAVEAYAKGDTERVTQITSSMFPLLLGVALVVLVGGGLFACYVDRVLTIAPSQAADAKIMMGLMMLMFAVQLPLAPFSVGFHVRQKFVLGSVIHMSSQAVSIALLFTLLFGVSTRVLWVTVSMTAARLLEAAVKAAVSRRLVPALRFKAAAFRWDIAKVLMSFGGWRVLGQVAAMIRNAAPALMLNEVATAPEVASFHLGAMPDRHFRPFVTNASAPLSPALTAMHAVGDRERLANAYLRITRLLLWVSMMVAVPLIIFRTECFQLFLRDKYSAYASAGAVMALLLVCFPVAFITQGLVQMGVAMAKVRAIMLIELCGQVANFALIWHLVSNYRMGAVGVAVSMLVTGVAAGVLGYIPWGLRALRLSLWRLLREACLPGLFPAVVGLCVCAALRALIQPSTWLQLGGCAAVGLLVYMTVILVFCLLPADRNDVRRILARLFPRTREAEL